jgi:hypothetical protein
MDSWCRGSLEVRRAIGYVSQGWPLPTLIVTGDSPQTKTSEEMQMRDSLHVGSMVAACGKMEVKIERAALSILTMPASRSDVVGLLRAKRLITNRTPRRWWDSVADLPFIHSHLSYVTKRIDRSCNRWKSLSDDSETYLYGFLSEPRAFLI